LNSKGQTHEKRARHLLTRPEPTSNGNCISWELIVGKFAVSHRGKNFKSTSLQLRNMNSSTAYSQFHLGFLGQVVGDLWNVQKACQLIPHRGVLGLRYIAKMRLTPRFYTNWD
jgi:hypothetical protein